MKVHMTIMKSIIIFLLHLFACSNFLYATAQIPDKIIINNEIQLKYIQLTMGICEWAYYEVIVFQVGGRER